MKNKDKGLPRLTVIERYMRDDEDIKTLFDFDDPNHIVSTYIETTDFLFSSNKIIKPDVISFTHGNKWNLERLLFEKSSDENWQDDIVEYGSKVFVSPFWSIRFCDDIKFIYENGRKDTVCDDIFTILETRIFLKKLDYVNELVTISLPDFGYTFHNTMITDRSFDGTKETDKIMCDFFNLVL